MSNDPWDNYDYHDSKIVLEMILGVRKQNLEYATAKSKEDFLIFKFINFILLNEINQHLVGRGNRIIDELFAWLQKDCSVISEVVNPLFNKHVLFKSDDKKEEVSNEINELESKLNSVFELFIEHLKREGAFAETKQEYLL